MTSAETIELGGDATKLIAAYKAANQAAEENRRKASQYAADTKREAQEENRLIRDAKKATEERIPAQQKLEALQVRYDQLVKKGRVSQDEANAALARQKKLLEETEGATDSLVDKAVGGAGEIVASLAGFGTAISGVLLLINQVKAEYDLMLQREQERAKVAIDFGEAMRGALANFTPDQSVGRDAVESRIQDIAAKTGATPEAVAQVAGAAFSSKANLPNDVALNTVEQAFRVNPRDVSGSEELASRALHLMAPAGIADPRVALGMIAQAGGKATTTNFKALGQNMLPAMVSSMATGDSAEQAAELFVTLNALMKDKEGSVSKTAAIGLSDKLAEFMPSMANSQERIAALQADEKLRAKFLESNTFEAQAKAPIRQLLSGEAGAVAVANDIRAGIGGMATGIAAFEEFVGGMNSQDSQFLPAQARRNDANLAAFKLDRRKDAAQGQATKTFDDTLAEVDFPGVMDFWQRGVARTDVIGLERQGMSRPEAQATVLGGILAGSLGPKPDQSTVTLLQDQITILRDIAASNAMMSRNPGPPPENALGRK